MSDPLKAASDWYVRLHEPDVGESVRLAFERWRTAAPQHSEAWERILFVNQQFEGIAPGIGKTALQQRSPVSAGRRRVLKQLAIVMVVSGSGLLAYRQKPWQEILADYATDQGERRTFKLSDETVLVLNTGSAIDTHYSNAGRTVMLLKGEIMITTGHGAGSMAPFSVQTRHGRVTALGTRFSVRDHGNYISVRVYEGAVLLDPQQNQVRQTLHANQAATFTENSISAIKPLLPGSDLWVKGILSVSDMPLKDFLAELGRYHAGFLRCDPAIEYIAVSGAFPLNDLDAILASLTKTYPVRVETLTRFWLTLKPA